MSLCLSLLPKSFMKNFTSLPPEPPVSKATGIKGDQRPLDDIIESMVIRKSIRAMLIIQPMIPISLYKSAYERYRERTLAGRIATGAVSHIGGSEGFAIGCRSRHNFLQNIGRRFLPYKVMNLFPGRVLGKCRVQPEPVARSLTHRLCMRCNGYTCNNILDKICS
ncbi:hypothetical protein EVAR_19432_1 [Eumeta japonica]|uniref:Uncharacterized protein n=1 Tax=Eumeta variegata TaxID=151549 RepID=A0A4C1TRV5_EUMVA|nr:hypothetical protein EVAR_19432_1 [Eumeta japonica]